MTHLVARLLLGVRVRRVDEHLTRVTIPTKRFGIPGRRVLDRTVVKVEAEAWRSDKEPRIEWVSEDELHVAYGDKRVEIRVAA